MQAFQFDYTWLQRNIY